jgi:predicted transcriptional regulator
VKIAVSVPDALHRRADEFAARLGLKRSQLYARAVEEFMLAHDADPVTAALDALTSSSTGEGHGRAAGRALIDSGDWEW